jgi:LysM repeat protein
MLVTIWPVMDEWLKVAMETENQTLLKHVIKAVKALPVTYDILISGQATLPKMVKKFIKKHPNDEVKSDCTQIYERWKGVIADNTSLPDTKPASQERDVTELPSSDSDSSDADSGEGVDLWINEWFVHHAADDETPREIAKKYAVSVADLLQMNEYNYRGIKSDSKLEEGTTISVPTDGPNDPKKLAARKKRVRSDSSSSAEGDGGKGGGGDAAKRLRTVAEKSAASVPRRLSNTGQGSSLGVGVSKRKSTVGNTGAAASTEPNKVVANVVKKVSIVAKPKKSGGFKNAMRRASAPPKVKPTVKREVKSEAKRDVPKVDVKKEPLKRASPLKTAMLPSPDDMPIRSKPQAAPSALSPKSRAAPLAASSAAKRLALAQSSSSSSSDGGGDAGEPEIVPLPTSPKATVGTDGSSSPTPKETAFAASTFGGSVVNDTKKKRVNFPGKVRSKTFDVDCPFPFYSGCGGKSEWRAREITLAVTEKEEQRSFRPHLRPVPGVFFQQARGLI